MVFCILEILGRQESVWFSILHLVANVIQCIESASGSPVDLGFKDNSSYKSSIISPSYKSDHMAVTISVYILPPR